MCKNTEHLKTCSGMWNGFSWVTNNTQMKQESLNKESLLKMHKILTEHYQYRKL